MSVSDNRSPTNSKMLHRRRSVSEQISIVVKHPITVWFDRNFVKLRKFLRKASARDKLLATLQYYFTLQNALLPETSRSAVSISNAFESSLSAARKGFRLFKWIDEYGKIRKIFLTPSKTLAGELWKIAPILMRLLATGYYLVDNWLWSLQIIQGARYGRRDRNAELHMKQLKVLKNNLSLGRTIIALLWTSRLIGILIYHPPPLGEHRLGGGARYIVSADMTLKSQNKEYHSDEETFGTRRRTNICNHPAISTMRPWHECLLFHTVLQLRGMLNFAILGKHLGFVKGMSNAWVGRLGMLASILGMWKHWGDKHDYFVEYK